MSLDFGLTDIENYQEVCYDDGGELRPVTHALIFATMTVGLGKITKKNADEFYARVSLYERVAGTYLNGPDGDIKLTPEDVRNHIGLGTNVNSETRAQWARRIITGNVGLLNDLTRIYRQSEVIGVIDGKEVTAG